MDFVKAIVLFWFALNVIGAECKVDNFDGYWQQRAMEANLAANRSYHPNPEEITQSLNLEVHKLFESSNSSRRDLLGLQSKRPCAATNPIDRCWRCDPNWAKNRKKLADCVLGFGRKARGGKAGRFYVVTDPSDRDVVNPKPGTLRHAVIQPEPLWIIFKHGMVIKLSQELMMTSDKTIDARGANVHISNGAQITLQFVRNIIIHGLHIHDTVPAKGGLIRDSKKHVGLRLHSDGDAISMFEASDIWIDHISMSNCKDGLIDAVMGSTGITISNCHLTDHNDVMLFGASNTHIKDKRMQITLAFNHFGRGLVQRMPRVRFGFVHVVNNQYSHWVMYAIGGSSNPTILSEGNRFTAPPNRACKEVTKREYAPKSVWKNWNWRSEGDLLLNGATFLQSGVNVKRRMDRRYMITAKPGKFAPRLVRYSGALACFEHKPC